MKSFFNRYKKFAIVLCVLFFLFKGIHWWEGRGQGFRLYKIQSNLPYDPRWDTAYSPEEIAFAKEALNQPYEYLGHGFQCYAFQSKDGKYVLKFFRHQRLRLPQFVLSLPSLPLFDEWRKARILTLSRRLDYLLRSCKTSWDCARWQTAILMVHLNNTNGVFPSVKITDSLGNCYQVPLDKSQFLLQKKALLIKPTIVRFMDEGDVKAAKECLAWIFQLLTNCVKNEIQDTDGALIRKNNLGILLEEKRAIYIDGGKLKKHTWKKKEFEKDLKRLYLLRKWLKEEYPSLLKFFDKEREKALAEVESFISDRDATVALETVSPPEQEPVPTESVPSPS